MKRMTLIKPVKGRHVRDPETYDQIPLEGKMVERSGFWIRRIREGDVVESVLEDQNELNNFDLDVLDKPKKGVKNVNQS